MFDFEKLDVYAVVENLNIEVSQFLEKNSIDSELTEHWKNASLASVLQLAEGVGRLASEEKKQFLTQSRGHIFQCVAILRFLQKTERVSQEDFDRFYDEYEKSSKMLLGMYRSLK